MSFQDETGPPAGLIGRRRAVALWLVITVLTSSAAILTRYCSR